MIRCTPPNRKRKIFTEEHRKNISKSLQGRKLSEEHCKHISEAQKGRMPPNRKGIPLTEEHKRNLSSALKGRKMSKEHCDKISKSLKGRKLSEEHIRNSAEGHKGLPCSDEKRRKVSAARKGCTPWNKGKHGVYTEEHIKFLRDINKGRWCGENSNTWKGGTSFLPYCYKFNIRRKKATRKYFNDHCVCCGKHVTENIVGNKQWELDTHHTDHDKEQGCNGRPFNLVPLCRSCHLKELRNEKEYRDYINKTLREGFKWGIWNEQEYIEKVMYDE